MTKNKKIDNLNSLLESLSADKKASSPDEAFSTYLENALRFEHAKTYKRKCEDRKLLCFFTFPRIAYSSVFAAIMIFAIIYANTFKSEKEYINLAQKELDSVSEEVADMKEDLDQYEGLLSDLNTDFDLNLEDL